MREDLSRGADFCLPLAFKRIVEGKKSQYILEGGRLGGKTSGGALVAVLSNLADPYQDIVVARVSYGSLADSSYAEFEGIIDSLPEKMQGQFTKKRSPLRIERIGDAGTIYFIGYGGSNTSRTKSFKSKHPIQCVILEETQELKDKENLEQALASLRRRFGQRVKVLIMGNPPPQKAHWFNQYITECKSDPDYEVIHLSWMDIVPFINDFDLKEILKAKAKRPDFYEWFYMGVPTGAFGSVYPMFNADRHVITGDQFAFFLENSPVRIAGLVIGGDGAVNRDATAFVPIFILTNGQSVVGPIFYHDPKEDGAMGYHKLVHDHVTRWFAQIQKAFNLGTVEDRMRNPYAKWIPIWFRIDSAAADLVKECQYAFGGRADVKEYSKSTVQVMVGRCQSAISADMAYIADYGGYYDYVQNKWVQREPNLLAGQLDQLIWNDRQDNYDPIVPNDVCDAWTYGTNFWFANTENMQWFDVMRANSIANCLIRDKIKNKEN